MIEYLERGRANERLTTHLTHCSWCQRTLDRHRRLLALHQTLEPQTEKAASKGWFARL